MTTLTTPQGTLNYTYDNADQILSESRSGYSASYTYDANGNRTSKPLNGVTDTYNVDSSDKLLSVTRSGSTLKSYTYDSAGRTTSVTSSAGTTNLVYDYEDRITSISLPGGTTNNYTYNGLDTRVGKVESSGTKTFLRDGVSVTAPVLKDGAAVYTDGVSEKRSGVSTFYAADRQGTVTVQTTAAQTIAAVRGYDAFGMVASSSGVFKGPFGYVGTNGYQEDNDSGLKLLGHRYYDSASGRFITRDHKKDGRNWYSYCLNNPLKSTDPTGLFTLLEFSKFVDDHLFGGAAGDLGNSWGNWESGNGSGWEVAGKGALLAIEMIAVAVELADGVGEPGLGAEAGEGGGGFEGSNNLGPEDPGFSTKRPSKFRNGTLDDAWEAAEDGPTGGKTCPTCGEEVHVPPNSGTPRDRDGDHQPPWSTRGGWESRKELLDDYNEGVRLECPSCNRGRGAGPL